ncbi:MAG TPA: MFS transporter [Ktedonobacteraceae bacterium]|nr:MFS transporter [Ktedonobacteraceae bacterium]
MWFRILILALGTFALGTDSFVIAGILPSVAHDLNVSVAMAGLAVAVFSLTYALGAPLLATLTASLARRRLLLLSLLVFTSANILAACAANFTILLLARVLAACGAALYTPTASAVAAALAPQEQRGRALSLVTAGLTVSVALGVPLGTLIGTQLHWQATFVLIAALGTLALLGIWTRFPDVANPAAVGLSQRLALLRSPALLATLGTTTAFVIGFYTVFTYLGVVLEQVTHLDGAGVSSMLFLSGIASMLGNSLGGYGADRWGSVRTLAIGLVGVILALSSFPLLVVTPLGAGLVVTLWGLAGWMLLPPQQHRLIALAPQMMGIILSLNASAIYLGAASGAAVGGLVIHSFPISTLGWVGTSWELLALGIFFLSVWLTSRRTARSTGEAARQETAADIREEQVKSLSGRE